MHKGHKLGTRDSPLQSVALQPVCPAARAALAYGRMRSDRKTEQFQSMILGKCPGLGIPAGVGMISTARRTTPTSATVQAGTGAQGRAQGGEGTGERGTRDSPLRPLPPCGCCALAVPAAAPPVPSDLSPVTCGACFQRRLAVPSLGFLAAWAAPTVGSRGCQNPAPNPDCQLGKFQSAILETSIFAVTQTDNATDDSDAADRRCGDRQQPDPVLPRINNRPTPISRQIRSGGSGRRGSNDLHQKPGRKPG